LQFNITFPQKRNVKKLRCFTFLYFHNCWNLNLGPTGACYQDWNNLGVRAMVAESRARLATNIVFTTVVVSYLRVNYWFLRHRYTSFYIRYWQISVFYRAPKTSFIANNKPMKQIYHTKLTNTFSFNFNENHEPHFKKQRNSRENVSIRSKMFARANVAFLFPSSKLPKRR